MKRNPYKIIALCVLLVGVISCFKNEPSNVEPEKDLLHFTSIRSYPTGIAEVVFHIDCNKLDTITYKIEWIYPQDAAGCFPYKLIIEDNYTINYNLINKKTYNIYNHSYEIGIDSIINKYDYREVYIGNYNLTIYSYKHRLNSDLILEETYDTLECIGMVEKFMGYIAGSDSNYEDIDFKLGIKYDDYSLDWDNSRCGNVNYYTDGYLHPSINMEGTLSYPEFESCEGQLIGYIRNDSLLIDYSWNSKWDGFSRQISGVKIE